ncbi:NUDIX hydrolase [Gallibacterium salpingitidis]|uniref:NUDIX hydrolase n=1 Tax=Gallibacterium salpingitidis TaxID=505341 RepID=A0AB36E4B7_9PAST|nr:NUDIX domain-containing protein [Gallibacterium salpingitidis]OBX11600.1 NUDIX hydrolase [Gallibacterium salpingitidis]WKS99007.1 NUDIX domain-containing protein [Gallibacterium salpingitidis]
MTQHIDKLAWILLDNKRVLMTRSYGKDQYYLPGGKREKGESDQQALIREIKEELNVDLLPDSLQLVETFQAQAHGKAEGVMVIMRCYQAQYQGELSASAEIEEIRWLTTKDKAICSQAGCLVLDYLFQQNLID